MLTVCGWPSLLVTVCVALILDVTYTSEDSRSDPEGPAWNEPTRLTLVRGTADRARDGHRSSPGAAHRSTGEGPAETEVR